MRWCALGPVHRVLDAGERAKTIGKVRFMRMKRGHGGNVADVRTLAFISMGRRVQNLVDTVQRGLQENAGHVTRHEKIINGPLVLTRMLLIRSMKIAMRRAGIASHFADATGNLNGVYLCYDLLHTLNGTGSRERPYWMHVISLPETAALRANLGMASMVLDIQVGGLKAAVRFAIKSV
ncbi:Pyrrolidone-carboxylate peptidase [Porphyridium purpureum]|uniref:Pyrrolidone-carboxylate peptidase n=1 Tax=Porphyridium purpureum TaxID=35688 RepID=A0A5J4YWA0_PORPP|nr:Pyrrolidone-carboxylate peptidase [Porphyridium purpureum]|eukprot:POR2415..scf227_4